MVNNSFKLPLNEIMLKKLLQSRIHTPSATPVENAASASEVPGGTKRPPKPVPQGQVRPKSRSMRDSDIKDEHGRSAEQIAAEAAKEFDIESVVRKAASMPDAPDRPVRPKTSLISPINSMKHAADKSRIHVADNTPAPVPQAPQVAPQPMMITTDGRPVTQFLLGQAFPQLDPNAADQARPVTQVFQSAEYMPQVAERPVSTVYQAAEQAPARPVTTILQPEMPQEAHAPRPVTQVLQETTETAQASNARPVSQVLQTPQDAAPQSRPVSRIMPSLPHEPERAAEKSKLLELGAGDRVNKKDAKVKITNGHICSLGPSQETVYATEDAREAYWQAIGESDEELLSYGVTPELRGMPAWPTQTQAFRIVRTENSVIIASEGLSDPFGPYDSRSGVNGFGLEVYLEIVGWQSMIADNIYKNWAFRAVEHVARIVAHAQNLNELLKDEVLSMDLPQGCLPKGWVVPGMAEPAGALLGVPQPPNRGKIKDMPLSDVMVVPITPIFPEELESCVVEGPSERRALAHDLLTTGAGHRADMGRTSLR